MSMRALSRLAATTGAADCSTSLSQTTTEKLNRPSVCCFESLFSSRLRSVGRRSVQMQTVTWGSIFVISHGQRSEVSGPQSLVVALALGYHDGAGFHLDL